MISLIRWGKLLAIPAIILAIYIGGRMAGKDAAEQKYEKEKAISVMETLEDVRERDENRRNINSLNDDAFDKRMSKWRRDKE